MTTDQARARLAGTTLRGFDAELHLDSEGYPDEPSVPMFGCLQRPDGVLIVDVSELPLMASLNGSVMPDGILGQAMLAWVIGDSLILVDTRPIPTGEERSFA